MLRRIEREDPRTVAPDDPLGLRESGSIVVAPVVDVDLETSLLPRDHPQWVKDALSVSNRARELAARLKPVVVKILTFWDHRVRAALVGESRVCIDPSGSYRLE